MVVRSWENQTSEEIGEGIKSLVCLYGGGVSIWARLAVAGSGHFFRTVV